MYDLVVGGPGVWGGLFCGYTVGCGASVGTMKGLGQPSRNGNLSSDPF